MSKSLMRMSARIRYAMSCEIQDSIQVKSDTVTARAITIGIMGPRPPSVATRPASMALATPSAMVAPALTRPLPTVTANSNHSGRMSRISRLLVSQAPIATGSIGFACASLRRK